MCEAVRCAGSLFPDSFFQSLLQIDHLMERDVEACQEPFTCSLAKYDLHKHVAKRDRNTDVGWHVSLARIDRLPYYYIRFRHDANSWTVRTKIYSTVSFNNFFFMHICVPYFLMKQSTVVIWLRISYFTIMRYEYCRKTLMSILVLL